MKVNNFLKLKDWNLSKLSNLYASAIQSNRKRIELFRSFITHLSPPAVGHGEYAGVVNVAGAVAAVGVVTKAALSTCALFCSGV